MTTVSGAPETRGFFRTLLVNQGGHASLSFIEPGRVRVSSLRIVFYPYVGPRSDKTLASFRKSASSEHGQLMNGRFRYL